MELLHYLVVLRNRWRVLAAAIVVAVASAWVLSPGAHQYKATSTLYIGSRVLDFKSSGDAIGQLTALDRVIETFANMVDSEPIARLAITRTKVNKSDSDVVSATHAAQIGSTQLLAVSVFDENPETARSLANALSEAFVEQVQTFEPRDPAQEGAVPALPAYVFERARLPVAPQPTGLLTNLIGAAALGLGLAVAFVLLADHLDVTLRGIEDAERRLELPVLGSVPDLGPSGPPGGRPAPRRQGAMPI